MKMEDRDRAVDLAERRIGAMPFITGIATSDTTGFTQPP
jgi:hypothetical protein